MATGVVEDFGVLLRRYRLSAGLSQEALAERATLSASAVAALERGRRTAPRPDTVALLSDALALVPSERATLVAAATGGRSSAVPPPALAGATPATTASLAHLAHTLPVPPTPLIGREREEAAVAHLLRPAGGGRLVTPLASS